MEEIYSLYPFERELYFGLNNKKQKSENIKQQNLLKNFETLLKSFSKK